MKAAHITILCLLSAAMFGCPNSTLTSSQHYQIASTSYKTAVSAVTSASQGGFIDLEDLETFNEVRQDVNVLLNEWEAAILSGEQFGKRQMIDNLLDRMIQLQIAAKKRKEQSNHDGNPGSLGDLEIRRYARLRDIERDLAGAAGGP